VVSLIVEWIGGPRQLCDHLAHLLVIKHGDADDVGGGDGRNAIGQPRARLGQRSHRVDADIEHRQPAGPLHHALGHRRTHFAQADIAQLHIFGSRHRYLLPTTG
jgi:hypothetical protein